MQNHEFIPAIITPIAWSTLELVQLLFSSSEETNTSGEMLAALKTLEACKINIRTRSAPVYLSDRAFSLTFLKLQAAKLFLSVWEGFFIAT